MLCNACFLLSFFIFFQFQVQLWLHGWSSRRVESISPGRLTGLILPSCLDRTRSNNLVGLIGPSCRAEPIPPSHRDQSIRFSLIFPNRRAEPTLSSLMATSNPPPFPCMSDLSWAALSVMLKEIKHETNDLWTCLLVTFHIN